MTGPEKPAVTGWKYQTFGPAGERAVPFSDGPTKQEFPNRQYDTAGTGDQNRWVNGSLWPVTEKNGHRNGGQSDKDSDGRLNSGLADGLVSGRPGGRRLSDVDFTRAGGGVWKAARPSAPATISPGSSTGSVPSVAQVSARALAGRKRHRLTLVCDNCKRRKIKCDKGSPCTSCVRSHLATSCGYSFNVSRDEDGATGAMGASAGAPGGDTDRAMEEIRELKQKIAMLEHADPAAPSGLDSAASAEEVAWNDYLGQIERLTCSPYSQHNMVGLNPVTNTSETISFYEMYSFPDGRPHLSEHAHGPLSWKALIEMECGASMLNDYLWRKRTGGAGFECEPALWSVPAGARVLPTALMPIEEPVLVRKITTMLPPVAVVWALIDRFFVYVYPFVPHLDQQMFERQVLAIVCARPPGTGNPSVDRAGERADRLKLLSKLDFAVVGILMIVLRLSYLSLVSSYDSDERDQVERAARAMEAPPCAASSVCEYVVGNPITYAHAEIAGECMSMVQRTVPALKLGTTLEGQLLILQLLLLVRIYNYVAPEDDLCSEGDSAQVATALVLQMALTQGFHHDPRRSRTTPPAEHSPRLDNLRRKIWHFIVQADLLSSYMFGLPLMVPPTSYDTDVPESTPENANLYLVHLDKLITNELFGSMEFVGKLQQLLRLILDPGARPRMCKVLELLTSVEQLFYLKFVSFEKCLQPDSSTHPESPESWDVCLKSLRVYRVKYYIAITTFFLTIYFHLFVYYSHKNDNLSFFYITKSLTCILEIIPYFSMLVDNCSNVTNMFTNPTILIAIHKFNQICLLLIARLGFISYQMRSMSNDMDVSRNVNFFPYLNSIENLKNSFTKISHHMLHTVSRLSDRYFYAWQITKTQNFLLNAVQSDSFYKEMYHDQRLSEMKCPKYSFDQLKIYQSITNDLITKTINMTNNNWTEKYIPDPAIDAGWEAFKQHLGDSRNLNESVQSWLDGLHR